MLAKAYRAAGAEVFNITGPVTAAAPFASQVWVFRDNITTSPEGRDMLLGTGPWTPDLNRRASVEAAVPARRTRMVYFTSMNKSDLNAIKDIVNSALETHLASVHEELTDLRRDMDERFSEVDVRFTAVEGRLDRLGAKIDHVDEKLGNFENREIDERLQLEVRVARLEKQRS